MINDSITIPYTNESEIISVIKSLKRYSVGYDGIPASVTKQLNNSYIKPLSHLIKQIDFQWNIPNRIKISESYSHI